MDFDEAIQSDGAMASYVVEVPADTYLQKDVVIVDTPGEGSVDAESAITMAYLAEVDAAVFCIPATSGTIHAHALEFIANPALRRAHRRMVFALTMADLKKGTTPDGEKEIDVVRREVIKQLRELAANGRFDAANIEHRVVPVSVRDDCEDYSAPALIAALKKHVCGESAAIAGERVDEACRALAADAAAEIEERAEALTLDSQGIQRKIEAGEQEKREAEAGVSEIKKRFESFRELLPARIGNAFDANAAAILHASSLEDMQRAADQMANDISSAISRLAKLKLGEDGYTIDRSFDATIRASIPAALNRINRTAKAFSDLAFTALSAGVAGVLEGGATAAQGALRGAATVATNAGARTLAAPAAKTGSKKVLEDACKVTKEVAKKAPKSSTAADFLCGAAKVLSNVLDSLNPFSYVSDWVTPSVKENKLRSFRNSIMGQADAIADLIWDEYQDIAIRPAMKKLEERRKAISAINEESEKARKDFVAKRRKLLDDARMLRSFASAARQ